MKYKHLSVWGPKEKEISNMKHAIVGVVALLLALWGLIAWWTNFGMVMRGLVPFGLLVFGLVSLASGYRRLQTKKNSRKEAPGKKKKSK